MNTKNHQIEIRGMPVSVVRKNIKNLHLAVYPPNGHVRIAVPIIIDDEAVRLAIISKLGWIRRQQKSLDEQPRQTARELITGESHYYFGKRYVLNIEHTDRSPHIKIRNKKIIDLFIQPDTSPEKKEEILSKWYREELKKVLPGIIRKWELKTNLQVASWGVKRMKTKWGSCNPNDNRIWLNLELIKKPIQCLEYIVVHEMVHFLEKSHNSQFVKYMDEFMPQWRGFRDDLNRLPLAHESWKY
jgi:predicted metal-dependent hydrolase